MKDWPTALRDGAITGSVASVASTLALVALSRLETGRGAAATNATSHWIWRARAYRNNRPSLRHTAVGYAIHHAASLWWAVLCERFLGAADAARERRPMARDAALTTVAAFVVDYGLTPKRLTPGFEERLSKPAIALVYLVFGLGLAGGMRLIRRDARSPSSTVRAARS